MTKFKIGSVVILRSGGPTMTVYLVHALDPNGDLSFPLYDVTWFEDRVLHRDAFTEPELIGVSI